MNIDLDILVFTFEAATRGESRFAAEFYDELIERHPVSADLLGDRPRPKQEQMLARALVAVLAHLDDPAWLHANLSELGKLHEALGVRREMYVWFVDCLIDCLADSAGDYWVNGAREHWRSALELVVEIMVEYYEHPHEDV